MGRFTRPIPLPAHLELPAPYPIIPLPDLGLFWSDRFALLLVCPSGNRKYLLFLNRGEPDIDVQAQGNMTTVIALRLLGK